MPPLPVATKPTTMVSVEAFKSWLKITASSITRNIATLTSTGLVAQANVTAHGYQTGMFVQIAGALQAEYNGIFLITVVNQNAFTYPLDTPAAASPATGTPTVTLDDGRYATMADAATAEIENETSLVFVQREIVETFNGEGKAQCILDKTPIISLSSLRINGVVISPSNYVLDAESGVLTLLGGVFDTGLKNCIATYTAGYDDQDGPLLPSDAVRACLDLAKLIHDDLVSNAISNPKQSLGGALVHFERPPSVQRVINNYAGVAMRP